MHESSSDYLYHDSLNYSYFSEDEQNNNNIINILDVKMNDESEDNSYNDSMYTPLNNIHLEKLITENTNYNKHEVNLCNHNILQKECQTFKIKSIQSTNDNDIDKITKDLCGNNDAKITKETSPNHKKEISNLSNSPNLLEDNNKNNKKINIKTNKKVSKNLNKKRKREKIFIILRDSEGKKSIYNNIKETKKNESKRGRKNENNNNKGKHDKLSIDNITNKIKRAIFNFARDIIKKNSKEGNIELKKFRNKTIEVLTKNKNEELFQTKLKDIFSNEKISSKYKKFTDDENKNIINKIYEEKKETKIIQILELTFQEILIIFRKRLKFIEDREKIRELRDKIGGLDLLDDNNTYEDIKSLINKNKEKYHDLSQNEREEYINKIIVQCCNYENWFNNKVSRIDLIKEK